MCNYRYLEFACSCTGEVWAQPCSSLERPPMCSVDAYWLPTQRLLGVCPGCSKKPDTRAEKSWGCVMVASADDGGGSGGNVEDGMEYDVVSGRLNCTVGTRMASRSSSSAGISFDVDGGWKLDNGAGTREAHSSSPSTGTDPDVDGEWEPDEMTPGGQHYLIDTQAASSNEVEVDIATKDNIEAITGPDSGEELELDDMAPSGLVDTQATRSNWIEVDTATKDNIEAATHSDADADGEWEPDDIKPGGQYCLAIGTQATGDNSPSADIDSDIDGEWEPDDMTPGGRHYLVNTKVTGNDNIVAEADPGAGGEWELDDMTPGGQHCLTDTQAASSNETEADVVGKDSIDVTDLDPDTDEELEPDDMTPGGQYYSVNTQETKDSIVTATVLEADAESDIDGEWEPEDMTPGGQHYILDAQTGSDWIEVDVVTNNNIETSADSDVDGEWEPDDMVPGGQHYIFDVQTTSNNEIEVDAAHNIEASTGSNVDGEWETDDMTLGGQRYLTVITQTTDGNASTPLNLPEGRTNGDYEPANPTSSDLVQDQDMHSSHASSSGQKQTIPNDSKLQKKRRRTAGVPCWATKNKKQKHSHSPPWKDIYADIPTSFMGKCGERRSGRIGWDNIR